MDISSLFLTHMMMINQQSAAMALLLPLLLALLLATGDQAVAAGEPSTSHRAVPELPVPKGYELPGGPSAATSASGHRHREIKIGPCFPSREGNALSSVSDRGNAPSCSKRCTDKGYAGGHCAVVSGGFPGDCFCVTA